MPGKVRRIVTGVNGAGRSYIVSDRSFPAGEVSAGQAVRVGLWTTGAAPVSNEEPDDPVPDGVVTRTAPEQSGGTVVRITDIAPDAQHATSAEELRRRGCKTTPDRSGRHPGFHATDTVDYAICLEGEVWAVLDEDETLMRPGDVLIQRGTYHAWSNRSDRICRMAFILIDAKPLSNH
jgi:quercetin dioxygenase-like cupin family protein